MLVKNWMSNNVITVDANGSMQDAMKILKEHEIRMLPVAKKSKLVGILTDRDLKKASASDATTLEIHEMLYLLRKRNLKMPKQKKKKILVPVDGSDRALNTVR